MAYAKNIALVGLAFALGLLCVATVSADPFSQSVLADDAPDALTDFGTPVSSDILGGQSGGQSLTIERIDMLTNSMNLNAEMRENLLISSGTGINQVSDNAFGNASGIATVVQNSGNQVIINNAFILNLQMQ